MTELSSKGQSLRDSKTTDICFTFACACSRSRPQFLGFPIQLGLRTMPKCGKIQMPRGFARCSRFGCCATRHSGYESNFGRPMKEGVQGMQPAPEEQPTLFGFKFPIPAIQLSASSPVRLTSGCAWWYSTVEG